MNKKDRLNVQGLYSPTGKLFNTKYFYHLIIFVFSFGLYANTIFNGYNLDDELVTKSHKLTSLGIKAVPQIFSSPYYSDDMGYSYGYRPVTLSTFAFEHQIFGDNVFVSHLTNVGLYAWLCLLIFIVIKQVLGGARLPAFLIALLFAAHPIHTEVVCSIKNREEILALLFSFLAMWVIFRTYQSRWLLGGVAAMLLYTLALLSKITVLPMAVAIPLALIVFTDVKFKKVLVTAMLLLLPALLIAEINLLIYKILLLGASIAGLSCVYIVKTGSYSTLKSKLINRLRSKAPAIPKSGVPIYHSIKDTPPPTPTKAVAIVNTKFAWRKYFEKIKWAAFVSIPFFALIVSVGGLFLNSFIWTGVGAAFLIAGIYFYINIMWYTNAALVFVLYILMIEKYDFQIEIISGVANILLLTLVVFGKQRDRFFFAVLLGLFAAHLYLVNGQGVLEIVLIMGFLYLVKRYTQWLKTRLYLLLGIAVAIIIAANLSALQDPGPQPLEDLQLAPFFFMLVILSQIRGKGMNLVIGLMIFFIPLAFMAEANLKFFETYKTSEYKATLRAQKRLFNTIFDKIPEHKIREAIEPIHAAAGNKIEEFKVEISKDKNTAVQNAKNLKRKFADELNKLDQKIATGKNKIKGTQNNVVNTVTTYEAKKIIPGEQNRPLSYVETPVLQKDPAVLKAASALDVLLRYLKLTLLPYPLSFYYGYKVITPVHLSDPKVIVSAVLYGSFFLLTVYLLWKRKYFLFYGIAFYLIMLMPFTNVWSVAGMMGERYLFGASLGFCMLVGFAFHYVFKIDHKASLSTVKPVATYIAIGLLLIYSISTFARNCYWKDDLTLMRHDIKNVEQSAQAHSLLALHLMQHSDIETQPTEKAAMVTEALTHFKRAIQIYPEFFNVAYYTAKVYEQLGMNDSAIAAYKYAITLDTTFIELQMNLADLLQRTGSYAEAIPYYAFVLKDRPKEYVGYDKLSYTYYLLHDFSSSIAVNKQAINMVPGSAEPFINIGRTYVAMNEKDSARAYFQAALNIDSGNANARQLLMQLPATERFK